MTAKELRRLSRRELMELLLAQSRELKELQSKYDAAEQALEDKTIAISQAGSIAEAALALSGIFEAAEEACHQYTRNVAALCQKQKETEL